MLYSLANNYRAKRMRVSYAIKDKNNHILTEPEEIAERWREYFCDLLNEPNEQFIVEQEEVIEREEENEQPITIDELQMAVSKMKNRKSPGDDGLPVEVLKAGGQNVMEQLLTNVIRPIGQKWYQQTGRKE